MPTNVLAPVARQRTFTDVGVVAPGALLYTYVSGTPATPLATTSDAAGAIPNANPIVASAGGLFGPIYLTSGVAYHFRLTEASGVLIWDQDPVVGGIGGHVDGNLVVDGNATIAGSAQITTLFVNVAIPLGGAQASIQTDGSVHPGLAILNTNAGNTINFVAFFNNASGFAGSISQNGANAVVYNTSSDARLKIDGGPASDLAALRAVLVHDFTWMADGIRDRGIFAQEAHALFPRAVTAGTDETTAAGALARPWQTDYSKFVPDLIVGWQQHDAAIAELRAAVATLTGSR